MEENVIKFSFVEGLFDNSKVELLVKLIENFGTNRRFLITSVSPDDVDRIQEMVTSCALNIGDDALFSLKDDVSSVVMIKKLSVAVRYAISGFKMVVDYGGGREERDCTYSILTPSCHIHIPLDVSDKKLEKCVASGIDFAQTLSKEGKSNMLCYYDGQNDKMVCESKDDYVRRKYIESGLVNSEE